MIQLLSIACYQVVLPGSSMHKPKKQASSLAVPLGQAVDVCVHREGGHMEGLCHHHTRRLMPYSCNACEVEVMRSGSSCLHQRCMVHAMSC